MTEPMNCGSCGGVDTLEYSHELGTLACSRCGTVSTSSDSHAFEYLARVDDEDRYQNGRHYISAGALNGDYGSLGVMQVSRGGTANNWARATGESRQIYQSQRRVSDHPTLPPANPSRANLARVATHTDRIRSLRSPRLDSLRITTSAARPCAVPLPAGEGQDCVPLGPKGRNLRGCLHLRRGDGKQERLAAHATRRTFFCLRRRSSECRAEVLFLYMQNAIDAENLFTLTRAVKIVKHELKLKFDENEPALFIEAILLHLNRLFSPSNAPSTSTSKTAGLPRLHAAPPSKKKHFSPENVTWLRSLSLTAVRAMTSGLLAFVNETELAQHRMPQNIACAVVLVALEGVARTPAPGLTEFIDEFAYTLGIKSFTIGDRYRQVCSALAEYAPRLPWLAGRTFTVGDENDDDEGSTPAAAGPRKRGRPAKGGVAPKAAPKRGWKRALVAYTSDIVQWRQSLDAKQRRLARESAAALERARERESSEGLEHSGEERSPGGSGAPEPGRDDEGAYFADPVFSGMSTDMYSLNNASSASSPALEESSAQLQSPKAGIGDMADATTKPALKKSRKRPPLDAAVTSSADLDLDLHSRNPRRVQETGSATLKPLPPLRQEVEMRQLFLAGHGTTDILAHIGAREDQYQKQLVDPAKPSTRLQRLQWHKPVEDITADEDLFDEGELETYLRSKSEVEDLLKLPSTKEMLEAAEARELAAMDRPEQPAPARRWRGRAFSRQVDTNVSAWSTAELAASGWDPEVKFNDIDIGDRGDWGCFGPSHTKRRRVAKRADTAETDGFAARPKKTRMTAERKQKIEAMLARKGVGDSDDDDYAGGSDEEVWLDQAVEVARREGEAIDADDIVDNYDDGDDDDEPAGPGDRDDWRAQLGYSADPDEEAFDGRDFDD